VSNLFLNLKEQLKQKLKQNRQEPASESLATLTPQQQLWNETSDEQHLELAKVLRLLKKRSQEDLCLGLVAYLRFGICRPFHDPLMQSLYQQCLMIVSNPK